MQKEMIVEKKTSEYYSTNFWIIFFIYITIFISSYVFFTDPFEFQFGYLVYLILMPVFLLRHPYPKRLMGVFVVLLLSGLFNILLGNNTSALFFKVFIGLFLSYIFYYYVVLEFKFNIEQLFKWYLFGSYIAALIGIIQVVSFNIGFAPGYDYYWIFNKWGLSTGGAFGVRVNGVFSEPTHLATVLSAAFFVSVYNFTSSAVYYYTKFQSLIIIIVYFLSYSGVGQLGIFLSILLLAINFGLLRYILIIIPLSFFLFSLLYNNVTEFKERYDSTASLFQGEEFKLGQTHGSSFILYNNYVVTVENFKGNFMFGGGIGSHPIAFEKYSIAKEIKVSGFNTNSADANSMLLRLISETGLFGTIIFLYVTFKCYIRKRKEIETRHWLISNGLVVMILLNLLRQGHYFLNGFPFFMMLYFYNYLSYQSYLETGKDLHELNDEESEELVPESNLIKESDRIQ